MNCRASLRRSWHQWIWMATVALKHCSGKHTAADFSANRGLISHKEMKAILQDKDAVRALHSAGLSATACRNRRLSIQRPTVAVFVVRGRCGSSEPGRPGRRFVSDQTSRQGITHVASIRRSTGLTEDGDEFRSEMTFIQFMQELWPAGRKRCCVPGGIISQLRCGRVRLFIARW